MNTILRLSGLLTLLFLCTNIDAQTCNFDPPSPVAPTVVACNLSQTEIIPSAVMVTDTVPSCNLFMSEYIEGSSNNKCIEIYNGTGGMVDLLSYELRIYSNGDTDPTSVYQFPDQNLADGMTFVLCHTSASTAFSNLEDDEWGSLNFNGNDAVALVDNGIIIDVIGQIGNDAYFAQDVTLVRKDIVQCGDTDGSGAFDSSTEFIILGTDINTNLGMHTYAGEGFVPTLFNFYDADPSGMANLLAGPVASYDPGGAGTFYVTAVRETCESSPTEVRVAVSSGGPTGLSCDSKLNLSLGSDCTLNADPRTYLEGNYDFDFFEVVFRDDADNIISKQNVDERYLGQTITYSVGNVCTGSSCWGKVTIDDKRAPQISVRDTTILCGESYSVNDLNPVLVHDCSEYVLTHSDLQTGVLCDTTRVITRTFAATDSQGNIGTAVQVITILPRSLSEITPPTELVTTDCGIIEMDSIVAFTGNIEDGYPTIAGVPVVEGEFCNFSVWKDDKIIEACGASCSSSVKVLRTWNIIDWCEEVFQIHTYDQLISAKDTISPTLQDMDTFRVSVDPWVCTADVPLPSGIGTDNCSDALTYSITPSFGVIIDAGIAKDLPLGFHRFTYTGFDCCQNQSEPKELVVEVYDGVPPTAIAKEEIVISMIPYENDGQVEAIAKIFAGSVSNGSYDLCGEVDLKVRRESDPCQDDSDEWGDYVTFCCQDFEEVHKVELLVTDQAGNTSISWTNVLVEAKEVFIDCKDLNLFCHDDIEVAISNEDNMPLAYNLCGKEEIVEVERDYSEYNSSCDFGKIYVTYAVLGRPEVTCVQTVHVTYKGGFSCENVEWPEADQEVGCMDLPESDLILNPGPCELIGWTLDSDTFSFNTAAACLKIVNEYTVVDWCIYDEGKSVDTDLKIEEGALLCNNENGRWETPGVFKYHQVIKVIDTVPPILANTNDWTFPIESEDCSINIKIDNSAYEPNECHNQHFDWQLDLDYDHDGVYDETLNDYDETDVWFMIPTTLYGPMDSISAQWKVWDGCGNAVKHPFKIFIVDTKPPIPYCIDLSSALMSNGMVELWAIDFDRDSRDNCYNQDQLWFTFDKIHPDTNYLLEEHYFDENGIITDQEVAIAAYENGDAQFWKPNDRSSAMIFTCEDLPEVTLKMTVWDQKLNYDYCSVSLTLSEDNDDCFPSPAIGGNIRLEDFRAVSDVEVNIDELGSGEDVMYLTGEDGAYEINNLLMNGNYRITPKKAGDAHNGVTTEDMLIIQRQLMQESEFTSPYQVIASDVNDDQKVSASDLLMIQRLAIGVINKFAAGEWKFVDAEQKLNFENALIESTYSTTVQNIVEPTMDMDFIAIKIGDVNNDVNVSARNHLSTRNQTSIPFFMSDQEVSVGQEITIPLSIKEKALFGYQMALKGRGLEFVGLENLREGITSIVSRKTDNELFLSYGNAQLATPEGELLALTVRATEDGKLSDMLSINNTTYQSEVYLGSDFTSQDISLYFVHPEDNIEGVRLAQNQPNPFNTETVIDFYLPKAGYASLSVMSVDGKVVFEQKGSFDKGIYQITIDKEHLQLQSGVFYYSLQYGETILTKRLILIN